MKGDQRHQAHRAVQASRFNNKRALLFLLCFTLFYPQVRAQCPLPSDPFYKDEEINFDLYFKWGILMPKAGVAKAVVGKSIYNNKEVWQYRLLLSSAGLIDKAFRVRDTIKSCFSPEDRPKILFASKNSDEGEYYQIDRLTFQTIGGRNAVHSFRRAANDVKVDSIMYGDDCIYDILGTLTYIRTIDWSRLSVGDEGTFNCAMGKDMIKVVYRYAGQTIIERGNAKYKTRHFIFDIYDGFFVQSKEAAEVWIGNDPNHIPIKIKAKLKIGAAEAYYASSVGLQYPLDCRIVMPKRYAEKENPEYIPVSKGY